MTRTTIDAPIAPITADPLVGSIHDLVSNSTIMDTEMRHYQHERTISCIPQCPDPSSVPNDSDRDGMPRDSFAINRKMYKHFQDESESSDNDSTAAESSSESSFSSSCYFYRVQDHQCERRRKVRFAMEADSKNFRPHIVVRYSTSPEPITPEEHDLLWYKQEDYRYFRKYSKKLASVASASKYIQELEDVLDVCESATSQDVTHCSRIANTAVRGLEVAVCSRITAKRRSAIQGVLETQTVFRGDPELETMLQTTSRSLSRSSRLMARILGNGDYAVARSLK